MNLARHPESLERLAAAYALGTLRGGARRRFESMARAQPVVRAAALAWQTRLSGMTELQHAVTPEPVVWTRIHNLVQADIDAARMERARAKGAAALRADGGNARSGGWWRSLTAWRAVALAGVVATVTVWVSGSNLRAQLGQQMTNLGEQLNVARAQLQASPQLAYVAVLQDEKSNASMLVTFDPRQRTLSLQRIGDFQEGADKSLQLWALPPSGGPRSLGVLDAQRIVRLTAAEGDVASVPTLAISLEPKGGVPGAGGPTGPVLFKGTLIQNGL